MTNQGNDDYAEWLRYRRSMPPNGRLTDRIMLELGDSKSSPLATSKAASSTQVLNRIGPALVITAASLCFAVKIAALVGILAFPTESFPEFANDQVIKEPADEHGNVSRS